METPKETLVEKPKITIGNVSSYEINYFLQLFTEIKEGLFNELKKLGINSEIYNEMEKYYSTCLDYTCLGGKMTRGLTVVLIVKCIKDQKELDNDLLKSACILGWCVEIMQAFFLVADDVMDSSHTRRNQPCWFRLPTVLASNAINDALFLCGSIYRILRLHFSTETELYPLLFDILQEMCYNTILGQHLDTNALPKTDINLSRVTSTRYFTIITHKTAYYSFYLPCALGMLLTGFRDKATFDRAKSVCLEMGKYFQTQDDYLDAFVPPEILGKIGTDIEERKCTWPLLQAMERASEEEKEQLIHNYGINDPKRIQCVKDIYEKLGLTEVYKKHEQEQKLYLSTFIKAIDHEGLQNGLIKLFEKIFKRPF